MIVTWLEEVKIAMIREVPRRESVSIINHSWDRVV